MKSLIILLFIFAIFFGLSGYTNAHGGEDESSKNDDGKEKCSPNKTNELINSFLLIGYKDIYKTKCSAGNYNFSKLEYGENPKFYDTYPDLEGLSYGCANKYIYILRRHVYLVGIRKLEVLQFNENQELVKVKHISEMFDNGTSITSDPTTGKIYWIVRDGEYSSIKVTDRSFNKSEYIIYREKTNIRSMFVNPKQGELIFLNNTQFYYISTLSNSTAKLLFDSSAKLESTRQFSIDYAADKLYWRHDTIDGPIINYVHVGNSNRPLNIKDIGHMKWIEAYYMVVFNNKLYWATSKSMEVRDYKLTLFAKSDNGSDVKIADLPEKKGLYPFFLTCPLSAADAPTVLSTKQQES